MKAIKYVVMSLVLAGFSASAMAQEAEAKAAIDAIKSKAANAAELVKTAQKKNKKNPEALVNIGRAFFEQGDTAQAHVFADLADVASKHKYAPAFILLGDVAAADNDGGKAAGYYNQATFADPKDPAGY
jgi:thioredoxin-like negative regulator of GroEL